MLLLDKPAGLTSNAALQTARRLLNAEKAGHTGTLDPMATGLLPLTFGEATKYGQRLLDADKTYEATIQIGVHTDSGDAEGQVLETRPVAVTETALEAALRTLRGHIEQVPPMYSALKRDGKPLYEYARAGIELERAPRQVRIDEFVVLAYDPASAQVQVRVSCSKGTYIRSLAIDLGARLGCGAHLSALRRTRIGNLSIAQAHALSALEAVEMDARDALLLPVDALLSDYPELVLPPSLAAALLQGRRVRVDKGAPAGNHSLVRLYAETSFIGVGQLHDDGTLVPKRLMATRMDLSADRKD